MEKQIENTEETFNVWRCMKNVNSIDVLTITERYYFYKEHVAKKFCVKNPDFEISQVKISGVSAYPSKLGETIFYDLEKNKFSSWLGPDLASEKKRFMKYWSDQTELFHEFKKATSTPNYFCFLLYKTIFAGVEHNIQTTSDKSDFKNDFWVSSTNEKFNDLWYNYANHIEEVKKKVEEDSIIGHKMVDNTFNVWACHYKDPDDGLYEFYFNDEYKADWFKYCYPMMTKKKLIIPGASNCPSKMLVLTIDKEPIAYKYEIDEFKELIQYLKIRYDSNLFNVKNLSNGGISISSIDTGNKFNLLIKSVSIRKYARLSPKLKETIDYSYSKWEYSIWQSTEPNLRKKILNPLKPINPNPKKTRKSQRIMDPIQAEALKKEREALKKETYYSRYGKQIEKEVRLYVNKYCDKNQLKIDDVLLGKYHDLVLNDMLKRRSLKSVKESVNLMLYDRLKLDLV